MQTAGRKDGGGIVKRLRRMRWSQERQGNCYRKSEVAASEARRPTTAKQLSVSKALLPLPATGMLAEPLLGNA